MTAAMVGGGGGGVCVGGGRWGGRFVSRVWILTWKTAEKHQRIPQLWLAPRPGGPGGVSALRPSAELPNVLTVTVLIDSGADV